MKKQQYRVTVRQFLTKRDENPVPMRTMFGVVLQETAKAVKVQLHGQPEASTTCLHCGRKLTHKVSLWYGIGPVCGQHFYITGVTEANLQLNMEEIKAKLAAVKWEGWLPKSHIEMVATGEYEGEDEPEVETNKPKWDVIFKFGGTQYHTVTSDPAKLAHIQANAEAIIQLDQVV